MYTYLQILRAFISLLFISLFYLGLKSSGIIETEKCAKPHKAHKKERCGPGKYSIWCTASRRCPSWCSFSFCLCLSALQERGGFSYWCIPHHFKCTLSLVLDKSHSMLVLTSYVMSFVDCNQKFSSSCLS